MKKTKIITLLLAALLTLCSLFTLTACTTYTAESEEDDTKSIAYGYSEFKNDAFIGEYFWHGHLGADMDIVLPDTYNGVPVTSLGGYVGTGAPWRFYLDFFDKSNLKNELFGDIDYFNRGNADVDINTQDEFYANVKDTLVRRYDITEFAIKDIVFNLHIGSNLQKIEFIETGTIKYWAFNENDENEVLTVYAISFEITVDEQNKYFYSDDLGRMYYKENDKLVDIFLYHNRDSFPGYSENTNQNNTNTNDGNNTYFGYLNNLYSWINELNVKDIVQVRYEHAFIGVEPSNLKDISYSTNSVDIENCYRLLFSNLQEISAAEGQVSGGSYVKYDFLTANNETYSVKVSNNRVFVNDKYYKFVGNFYYEFQHADIECYAFDTNNWDKYDIYTYATESVKVGDYDGLDKLEFCIYDGLVEKAPSYYAKTAFDVNLLILSQNQFMIEGDDNTVVYQITSEKDFSSLFEDNKLQ